MKGTLTACLAIVLILSPLLGGVVYEIDVTDHEQSPPKVESMESAVEGRNLKMGIRVGEKGPERTMIYRGDRREMVVVDHTNKSYFVMDQEQRKTIVGQLKQAMSQIQEALKNVPEDKRAMVEQMMKQRMPQQTPEGPKSELKKTGERSQKNGYPCVKYEVREDSRKVREFWVTDWGNVEGGGEVADVYKDMGEFFKEMMESFSGAGGGFSGGTGEGFLEYMTEMDGFPAVTRNFGEDGLLEGESVLRSARRQTIDPDSFEPPSGYKRQEMFRGP